MAANGDVLELQVHSTFEGKKQMNVFYYRIEDVPTAGVLTGLATEFGTAVYPWIRGVVASATTFTGFFIRNLFNVAEILEQTKSDAGTGPSTGNNLPSYCAWYFKLVRGNASVRNGRKMFGGLNEGMTIGSVREAIMVTPHNDLAAKLSLTLIPGGVDPLKPIIVGRVPYTTMEGKPSYRLPESQAEMAANGWAYVISAQYKQLSTMNTRKLWRGV